MRYWQIVLTTAIGPILWGTTYLVTTHFLPANHPIFLALIRALPTGILLLLITKKLPQGIWIWRSIALGVANFTAFFPLLFLAAYRLPGGVAAMLSALQPLFVIFLARYVLQTRVQIVSVGMGLLGVFGVALVVLRAEAKLDFIGIAAALCATLMMGTTTVLIKKWGLPTTPLNFTAWQLTAGGILLLPIALIFEGIPTLTLKHWLGFVYLDGFNTILAYFLWFRGLSLLPPTILPFLGLLSPVVAVIVGWLVLHQGFSSLQFLGMTLILIAIISVQIQNSRTTSN